MVLAFFLSYELIAQTQYLGVSVLLPHWLPPAFLGLHHKLPGTFAPLATIGSAVQLLCLLSVVGCHLCFCYTLGWSAAAPSSTFGLSATGHFKLVGCCFSSY